MRLGVAVMCALLAMSAAAPDAADLQPVDEVVEQLISGKLTPEDVVNMTPGLSPQYLQDVKNGLPDDLKRRIVELVHNLPEVPEPAEELAEEEGEEDSTDDDDQLDDDEVNTEDDQEPQLPPVEQAVIEPTAEESGVLRASVLRADPVEDGGTGAAGGGGGGSSGVSEGGVLPAVGAGKPLNNLSAARLLLDYSKKEQQACTARYGDAYEFYTKDHTLGPNKVKSDVDYLKLWRQFAENTTQYDLSGVDRTDLVAVLILLMKPGVAALDDTQLNELVTAVNNLETKLSSAKVCDFYDEKKCDLKLYKDIRVKMASSTDRDELAHYWLSWRGLVGRGSGQLYADYVRLLDTAAKKKNADWNAWSLMTYPYRHGNTPNILSLLEQLWEQNISPLYEQLHSYARIRLRQRYGTDAVPAEGPIPAHLLGSHEADDWSALEELMRPFDNASMLDFHGQCTQQPHMVDVVTLKKTASKLYSDLGLNATSVIDMVNSRLDVASPDADKVLFLPRVLDGCHASSSSAVGIYPTNTTLSDYIELIELFGTMQRFNERAQSLTADTVGFAYNDRVGFNAYGMDLAIGGARALAAITPAGLSDKLGFQIFDDSEHAAMNFQMAQALKLLPRLAASMAAVRWQSDVMTGVISENHYNDKWWEYKREYQGVSPPEERDNGQFDAFADGTLTLPNYHLRRLIGGIAMFSVHEYHCKIHDSSKPLSECAIFDNKELGNDIKSVLVSGNSKPLKDQLTALTGKRDLSADALVVKMQPLTEWLVQYNEEHGGESGGGVGENTEMIAIIVGVVIAVIVIGLVIFFVVARRKQKKQDNIGGQSYKAAPTREGPQHA